MGKHKVHGRCLMILVVAAFGARLSVSRACEVSAGKSANGVADRVVAEAIGWLRSPDASVRNDGLRSLREAGRAALPAVPEVLRIIAESDGHDDDALLESVLCGIGEPVIPSMVDATRSRNPKVRRIAVLVLSRFSEDARVPAALREALDDPAWTVRSEAVSAFAWSVPSESAFDTLLDILDNPDELSSIRGSAAAALGHSKLARAIEPVRKAMQSRDPALRRGAYAGLYHLGKTDLLLDVLENGSEPDSITAEHLCFALAKTKDPRAAAALERLEADLMNRRPRAVNITNMRILRNCIRVARGQPPEQHGAEGDTFPL